MTTNRSPACALAVLAFATLACAPTSRWQGASAPAELEVPVLLEAKDVGPMLRDIHPSEIPEIPIRERLRPCCAFGSELSASLGPIPVPFYSIPNVVGLDDVGRHSYDSGVLLVRYGGSLDVELNRENNGLVYTCRGGFIDTAHVRDYADWAIFVVARIAVTLESGGTIELGEEGGVRRIVTKPIAAEDVQRLGRRNLAMGMAAWLAFQMSVYHEIATGFGWNAVPGFPETASAFSPEDLYSNLLGVKIASASVYRRRAGSEALYNAAVDAWFRTVLEYLGAVDGELGREAFRALDGLWWDRHYRLPNPQLVQRRNFDTGPALAPWRVPDDRLTPALREACGGSTPSSTCRRTGWTTSRGRASARP
jgi:hypothetical protein